jgi:hypothetical protein
MFLPNLELKVFVNLKNLEDLADLSNLTLALSICT